ncbi:MAG: glycosyltransferase [Candidatus Aenigmarchaeota archaeon]|nr:glycosyltransferase [Candidatus Aenigmarchaeota archaeon]
MKFSFVIPAYNEGKFLGGCIKSIKAQNYKDYEIIVSYSPSKDNTLQIAKKHGAKVVTLPKCFPGMAKNAGARAATGEYLIFMDADTTVPGNFLSSTIKHLGRDRVAVAYPSRWSDGDRILDMFSDVVKNPLSKQRKLLFFCYVVKKSAFDKIGGFNKKMKANEDWDISKRLKKTGRITYNEDATVGVSARRFRELGKLKSLVVYSSWFIMGYVLGREAKYFHLSDFDRRR